MNDTLSNFLPVTSGVPQGSILGPLFFILYINDLSLSIIHSSLSLFADDSKCCKSISSIADSQLLQEDLDLITSWSKESKLIFNTEKTFLVRFHSPKIQPISFNYSFQGLVIDSRVSCRNLGVIFSESLSWSLQVRSVLQKAYKTLYFIKRAFPSASTPTAAK